MYPQIYLCGTGDPLPRDQESMATRAMYDALVRRFGGEPLLRWAYVEFLANDETEFESMSPDAVAPHKLTAFEREFDLLAPLLHKSLRLPPGQHFAFDLP